VCSSLLYGVAVCYSVLQCVVAVYVECVAVFCSMCVMTHQRAGVLQCVLVCCMVLQCVTVCCSVLLQSMLNVLQYIAVCVS